MSTTSPFLYCVATVLVSAAMFQSVEAVSAVSDRDRAVLTFNPTSDPCSKLNAFSDQAENDAAEWSCKEAFLALDRIEGNTCHGWRKPECRYFDEYVCRLCSCKISTCNQVDITKDITKSFRECAVGFWPEANYYGHALLSARFRQASLGAENALQASRSFRNSFSAGVGGGGGGGGGGTTNAVITFQDALKQFGSSTGHDAAGAGAGASGERSGAKREHICDTCGKPYASAHSLRQHKRSHGQSTTCPHCPKTYATTSNLYAHIKIKHPLEFKAPPSRGGVRKHGKEGASFTCDICGLEFPTGKTLHDHKKDHRENVQCDVCKRYFLGQVALESHINRSHPGYEAGASGTGSEMTQGYIDAYNASRPWVCEKCARRYSTRETLRQHMKSHETQLTFCTSCDQNFSTTSSYRLHVRRKHRKRKKPEPESSPGGAKNKKV